MSPSGLGGDTEPKGPAVDLVELARNASSGGIAWSTATDDLNVNLVVLEPHASTPKHVNAQLDVLLVGVDGRGRVTVDEHRLEAHTGFCIVIGKGNSRVVEAGDEGFSYLLMHRRRPGLWPEPP
jgi:quercetin dioxygenase-like cupin family protein